MAHQPSWLHPPEQRLDNPPSALTLVAAPGLPGHVEIHAFMSTNAISNIAKIKIARADSVTGFDTRVCECRRYGIPISTASARSRVAVELGWCAVRSGAEAWSVAARSASTARAARIASSVSRHVEGREGRSSAPNSEARGRAGEKLAGGLWAREVPARSLRHPERPRPHDRRGWECVGSSVRAQGDCCALCARRQSRVSPRRPRALRSLPRPRAADPARGPECDCVCIAQRAPPPCQARARIAADRANRSGVIGAMVLGLAHGSPHSPRSSRCCSAAHVAAQRRGAPTGVDRRRRGSGNCACTAAHPVRGQGRPARRMLSMATSRRLGGTTRAAGSAESCGFTAWISATSARVSLLSTEHAARSRNRKWSLAPERRPTATLTTLFNDAGTTSARRPSASR